MEIRHLPEEVTTLLHSSIKITSPAKCVLELIHNSLDAQATSIAIRVDSQKHKVQVVDNGTGMTKEVLRNVGEKNMTTKFGPRSDSTFYGSRGEALANIRILSSSVEISSRGRHSSATYVKVFKTGHTSQMSKADRRPAQGTTVTVYGFLDALPVRQACWRNTYDMAAIRTKVEALALANTQVSFSVRDDTDQAMVIRTQRMDNPLEVLASIYGGPISDAVYYVQGDTTFGFKFHGYIGERCVRSNVTQYVFLNRRPVNCIEIHDLTVKTFLKAFHDKAAAHRLGRTLVKGNHVLYLLYMECSATKYVLSIENCEASVEFHRWKEVASCIRNAINRAFGNRSTPCPVNVNDRNACESEGHEIQYPRILLGHVAERVKHAKKSDLVGDTEEGAKDAGSSKLFMTPLNMKPPLPKELPLVLRQNKPKKVLPCNLNRLWGGPYFGLPLKEEGQRIYDTKPKTVMFKNIYNKAHRKTMNFNAKMFHVNSKWRKVIFKRIKMSILNHDNYKSLNDAEKRRKQLGKYVKKCRQAFESNATLSKSTLKDGKAKKKMVSSKRAEKSDKISLKNLGVENRCLSGSQKTGARPKNDTTEDNNQDSKKNQEEKLIESSKVLNASSPMRDPDDQAKKCEYLNANNEEWSDWSYNDGSPKSNTNVLLQKKTILPDHSNFGELGHFWGHEPGQRFKTFRKYSFLPAQLNPLLNDKQVKLMKKVTFAAQMGDKIPQKYTLDKRVDQSNGTMHRRQDLAVRPCVDGRPFQELTLGKESLKLMQVVGRINNEFIAALTKQNDNHLVVLIDQHAIDERIRYETLLQDYLVDEKKKFRAIGLDTPILINDFPSYVSQLLLTNPKVLEQFGVRLSSDKNGSLIVTSVPKCFVNQRSFGSSNTLECRVRKLLQEIAESLIHTRGVHPVVPTSIHHAIASEACHGAIKFGDPLTLDQCAKLVKSLEDTNAPGRCAHGRPSMIPLLEISELDKRSRKIKVKLNFSSLNGTGREPSAAMRMRKAANNRCKKNDPL